MKSETERRRWHGTKVEKWKQILESLQDSEGAKARLEQHNFYQERIETVRARLWTTLTWLAAAQGAVLVLIIKEGGLRTGTGPYLVLDQPILIILLAFLGCALGWYMLHVVNDGLKNIRNNQTLCDVALGMAARKNSREWAFAGMQTLACIAIFVDRGS
jgi:hypothetical protein